MDLWMYCTEILALSFIIWDFDIRHGKYTWQMRLCHCVLATRWLLRMANYNAVDEEAKVKNKRKRVIVFTFIAVILVCAIAAPIIISQSKPQYQYKHTGLPQQQLTSQNDVMVDCSGRKGTESECKQNGYGIFYFLF